MTYLITAIDKWGQGLEMCCGRVVDIAVHAFILDTKNAFRLTPAEVRDRPSMRAIVRELHRTHPRVSGVRELSQVALAE
ncbi:hypothetical protein ACWCQQ_07040 [Streptomyces sp. NPDC002143]